MKYNKQSKVGLNVEITTPSATKDKTDELPFKLNFKVYEFYHSHQTVDYKIGVVESLSEINDTISKIKNNSTVDYIDNISQNKHHEDIIKEFITNIKTDDGLFGNFKHLTNITSEQFNQLIISANIHIYNNIVLKDIIRVDSLTHLDTSVFIQFFLVNENEDNNVKMKLQKVTRETKPKRYNTTIEYDRFHYMRDFITYLFEVMIDRIPKEIDSEILWKINKLCNQDQTFEIDTRFNDNGFRLYSEIEKLQTKITSYCGIQAKTLIMTKKVYDYLRNTDNGIFNKNNTPDSNTFNDHRIKNVGKTIFNDNVYVVNGSDTDYVIVSVNKFDKQLSTRHLPIIFTIKQLLIPHVYIDTQTYVNRYGAMSRTDLNSIGDENNNLLQKINVKLI